MKYCNICYGCEHEKLKRFCKICNPCDILCSHGYDELKCDICKNVLAMLKIIINNSLEKN